MIFLAAAERPNLQLQQGLKSSKVLILAVQPIILGGCREQSKNFEIDTPQIIHPLMVKIFNSYFRIIPLPLP